MADIHTTERIHGGYYRKFHLYARGDGETQPTDSRGDCLSHQASGRTFRGILLSGKGSTHLDVSCVPQNPQHTKHTSVFGVDVSVPSRHGD